MSNITYSIFLWDDAIPLYSGRKLLRLGELGYHISSTEPMVSVPFGNSMIPQQAPLIASNRKHGRGRCVLYNRLYIWIISRSSPVTKRAIGSATPIHPRQAHHNSLLQPRNSRKLQYTKRVKRQGLFDFLILSALSLRFPPFNSSLI